MKTLELFNGVVAKTSAKTGVFVSDDGYIIEPAAMWAKDRIISHYKKQRLNGQELNKTFHKSWEKVKNSSRYELLLEQIQHYASTYGSNFQDEIYIPDELLEIPKLELKYKVIKAYSRGELTEKCLDILRSGMALKEETINDLLSILTDEFKYKFAGDEGVKNKEAIIKIADLYGVLPSDTMDFFRYIVYRATGESLLIKNKKTVDTIKNGNYNPGPQFNKFGLVKLAEIFNRYKPLFLAFKKLCPSTINKISKLSKTHHKPLVENPLNRVTNSQLTNDDIHWLDNATPFALFKAYSACYNRMRGQNTFLYRIRNGTSWVEENPPTAPSSLFINNCAFLMNYMKERFDLSGTTLYIPEDIEYALPTSEKMFVGNIPTGTKFFGERLAVGVYWEDSWGASDLDLSSIDISGNKIGWNAQYHSDTLIYSGDITSAPDGAVEYMYANDKLDTTNLIMNNVYYGENNCSYKIIVGRGDNIDKNYMMNPNNLFMEVKCESVQKQTVLGILLPKDTQNPRQCFVILNFGAGHAHVSSSKKDGITALYQQWTNQPSFNEICQELGAEIITGDLDNHNDYIDLSLDSLEKDSSTKLFK